MSEHQQPSSFISTRFAAPTGPNVYVPRSASFCTRRRRNIGRYENNKQCLPAEEYFGMFCVSEQNKRTFSPRWMLNLHNA